MTSVPAALRNRAIAEAIARNQVSVRAKVRGGSSEPEMSQNVALQVRRKGWMTSALITSPAV